jgi:DNA polymerase III epsilon subunit family exonuclease
VTVWARLAHWLSAHHGPPLGTLVTEGFLALDLETTGLDPRRDSIVSLAAIPFVGGAPGPGYVTLVHPGRPIPPQATAIHGLTDAMVGDAPSADHVLGEMEALLDHRIVVGHGVEFDLAILNRARRARGQRALDNVALDTQRLTAVLRPGWLEYSLESVAAHLGVEVVGRHTAAGDALTAGRMFLALVPLLEARGFRTIPELLWAQRRSFR